MFRKIREFVRTVAIKEIEATPVEEKRKMSDYANCYEKARANGEQTFTLRAQDQTSPTVIAEWIKLNIETAPADKLRDALEECLKMRQHSPRRMPD